MSSGNVREDAGALHRISPRGGGDKAESPRKSGSPTTLPAWYLPGQHLVPPHNRAGDSTALYGDTAPAGGQRVMK